MKKNLAIMMIFAMLLMFYGMPVTISAEFTTTCFTMETEIPTEIHLKTG
jgi:hypothetical protein